MMLEDTKQQKQSSGDDQSIGQKGGEVSNQSGQSDKSNIDTPEDFDNLE